MKKSINFILTLLIFVSSLNIANAQTLYPVPAGPTIYQITYDNGDCPAVYGQIYAWGSFCSGPIQTNPTKNGQKVVVLSTVTFGAGGATYQCQNGNYVQISNICSKVP